MITPEQFVAEFFHILGEMGGTMLMKNGDYSRGNDPLKNLRRHGEYGIVVRLDDKLSRLDSLTNPKYTSNEAMVKDERKEDTAIDSAVYNILFVILSREANGTLKAPKGPVNGQHLVNKLLGRMIDEDR